MSEISTSPPSRVLFEGPIWPGSDSAPCFEALGRLGHRALDIDHNEYLSFSWSGLVLRSARRMLAPLIVKEYNQKIMRLAEGFRPDIFLAFKGELVLPKTLRRMREQGVRLYNFYPDTWVFSSFSPWLTESLGEYDCIFSTKRFTARDMAARGRPARNFVYLPHGYDPELHRPLSLTPRDLETYGCDVTFIGAFSPGKAQLLSAVLDIMPGLDLKIWGDGWKSCRELNLRRSIMGRPLYGVEYPSGLCASQIALGLLLEKRAYNFSGDLTTSRTFNIPATGTFMLHQRTDEVLEHYAEGKEFECFATAAELAEKIKFYLAHPEKRKAVAEAGYHRCVPAYSQDSRVRVIIDWHRQNTPR